MRATWTAISAANTSKDGETSSDRGGAKAYLLSFGAVPEPSILATAGSDEVRADAKLASGVPDSPSDGIPLRAFCGAMVCVFVRLRIC